jgi:hypothetical protein
MGPGEVGATSGEAPTEARDAASSGVRPRSVDRAQLNPSEGL